MAKITKVDVFSGFLGAGKTTLIKKLIREAYSGEMLVVIENEFGQIGIDGGFLKEAGIQITQMNSGCICCSLVGDFGKALGEVKKQYDPDRILIEPSGVGKLSDVIRAVEDAGVEGLVLNSFTTVIDAAKCKMYLKNYAEFYTNQIAFASTVIFSRTGSIRQEKLDEAVALTRALNDKASFITTPWEELNGKDILAVMEKKNTLEAELAHLLEEEKKKEAGAHHHHHHEEDEHEHHHHEEDEHEHHHHEEDEHEHHHHEDEHEHHHHEDEHEHHHHGEECDDPDCVCHHHHHHDADEVFTSWGAETAKRFTESAVEEALDELVTGRFGAVLRAKGIVEAEDGGWIHFDYVPGEKEIRRGTPEVTGKLCVIGSGLDQHELTELFLD